MKKIILIACLLLTVCVARSYADNEKSRRATLLHQLSKTASNDTARLAILHEIRQLSINREVELYYVNKLMQEAEAMDNSKYKCLAYIGRMTLAYNAFDLKTAHKWLKLLEPLARKEKLYDYLFLGKRCAIDLLILNEEFELHEKEATKMLKEAQKLNNNLGIAAAYQCLSNVYRVTYRNHKAGEVLKEAYKAVKLTTNVSLAIEITNSLITTYSEMNNFPEWLKWTKEQKKLLKEVLKSNPESFEYWKPWIMINETSSLTYYTRVNKPQLAKAAMERAEKLRLRGYSSFEYPYHLARYEYFGKFDQPEEALRELDTLRDLFRMLSPSNYYIYIFKKAQVLKDMNRENEALKLYKTGFAIQDSIQVVILNKQLEQLRKDYNTEQLVLEKQRINQYTQLAFIALTVLLIIVLACFVVHTYRIRIHLRKSEKEMARMLHEMEQANVAKELFLSTISTAISAPLNTVVDGSLQLAMNANLAPADRNSLSKSINKLSSELLLLINNILYLSRLEAGVMKYNEETLNVLLCIRGITNERSNQQPIALSLPEQESLNVHIDAARFQEILSNLLVPELPESKLSLTAEIIDNDTRLSISIYATLLASPAQTQDIAIANEVNRLLIEHFGGHYEVLSDKTPSSVNFTLPLA